MTSFVIYSRHYLAHTILAVAFQHPQRAPTGTVSNKHAKAIVSPQYAGDASVIECARSELQHEIQSLRAWGRMEVEHMMVSFANSLNLGAHVGIARIVNIGGIRKVWLGGNRDDKGFMDDFYKVVYGQFRRSICEVLPRSLVMTALQFVNHEQVKETGFTEADARLLSLVDCLAIRYQLTHFDKPVVYRKEYDEAMVAINGGHSTNRTNVLYGLPRVKNRNGGYTRKVLLKVISCVVDKVFGKDPDRMLVSCVSRCSVPVIALQIFHQNEKFVLSSLLLLFFTDSVAKRMQQWF